MTTADEHIPQAAAVPFREGEDGRLEVLLIRRRGRSKWGIPKGLVDPGNTLEQTALIESDEEAGVRGELLKTPLGQYEYQKFGGTCRVTVYPLRVAALRKRFLEDRVRERRWFSLEDAAKVIRRREVARMIRQLSRRLA